MLIRDGFDADQEACLICDIIALDALSSSVLYFELRKSRSLAHAVFRREKKRIALRVDLHSYDLVVLIQIHANDAHCRTSQSSDCFLLEANAHTLLRDKENVIFRSCLLHFDQLIVFPEVDRYNTASADIRILCDRSLLDNSFLSYHEEISFLIIVKNRNDRRNFLTRIQFQEVYDRCTSCSAARLRDLVGLHAVDPAKAREEHDRIMSSCHQKILNIVIVDLLNALDAASAAVLDLEVVHCHSLDVSERSHRYDCIDIRDQIFSSDVGKILIDLASSVVAELFCNDIDLILDDKKKFIVVREDRFEFSYSGKEFLMLLLQFLSFQTCQSAQTHIYDRLGLNIV